MNMRRAALLSFAWALAISFNAYSAEANKLAMSKSAHGESAGMYSNYADDGSVVSRKFLGNAGVDVLSEAEL
ncbi:MAG: hypothetical protein ABI728_02430, partial [Betaproteobacteria bacterium]